MDTLLGSRPSGISSRTSLIIRMAVVAVATIITMLVPQAVPARADSPPAPASGTVRLTSFTVTNVHQANGNTIIDFAGSAVLTGTFAGPDLVSGKEIVHPNGLANFEDVNTATVSVDGCGTGTILARLVAHGVPGALQGTVRTIDQSTNSPLVHMVLTGVQTGPATWIYFGTYHCG